MKFSKILFTVVLCLTMVAFVHAQRQTGSIRGTAVDAEGNSLPGVSITAASPQMLGTVSYVSSVNGEFRAPSLSPGTYTITAQLAGFKTVIREGVIVRVGMTVVVDLQMEVSVINEQVTVTATSPVVDMASSKITQIVSLDVMRNIPAPRNVWGIVALAPGMVANPLAEASTVVAHGSASDQNQVQMDGVNIMLLSRNETTAVAVTYDIMDEIEMISGGQPAEVGQTSGVFINMVTKSGGNKFSGGAQFYYTDQKFNQVMFPDSELRALGMGKANAPVYDFDTDLLLGGPIFKDRLWFYGSVNYLASKVWEGFKPTTFQGKSYEDYTNPTSQAKAFLKFTGQISESLKIMAMLHYTRPANSRAYGYQTTSRLIAQEARLDHKYVTWTATTNLQWILNSNTFMNLRGGYIRNSRDVTKFPGAEENYKMIDMYTGYTYGTAGMAQTGSNTLWNGSVDFTRFQDDFLGGSHEFKAGADFDSYRDVYSYYGSPLYPWYIYNSNIYYYRGLYGLTGSHPVYGDGRFGIMAQPPRTGFEGCLGNHTRISGFVQDTWTIKNRVTLNLGLRYDYYHAWCPPSVFGGNEGFSFDLGAYYLEPLWGFNPLGTRPFPGWDPILTWKTFSPRVGFNFDVFGNGKTALKASYSKYTHPISAMDYYAVTPLWDHIYYFNWWDSNNNGVFDSPPIDRYENYGGQGQDWLNFKDLMDTDVRPSYINEVTTSINHELARDLSVGVAFVYKDLKDAMGSGLYDPKSGRWWNTYEKAPDWWVPLKTFVPAYGGYPEQELTLYFMTNNAPAQVMRVSNMAEGVHKYRGVDFSFDKRMSNGWQLSGSVVLSKTWGNMEGAAQLLTDLRTPNYLINRIGRTANDRPLQMKLQGTFTLPYRILASFSYVYFSGSPFNRTVTVYPPLAWAAANNVKTTESFLATWVEPRGARRDISQSNLDLRVEKQFNLGGKRLGVFVDAFNVLGLTHVFVNQNPGGTWRPTGPDTNKGVFAASGTFGKVGSVYGTRIFKFSVRFDF